MRVWETVLSGNTLSTRAFDISLRRIQEWPFLEATFYMGGDCLFIMREGLAFNIIKNEFDITSSQIILEEKAELMTNNLDKYLFNDEVREYYQSLLSPWEYKQQEQVLTIGNIIASLDEFSFKLKIKYRELSTILPKYKAIRAREIEHALYIIWLCLEYNSIW